MRDAIALTEFRQLRNGRNRGSIHLPVRQAGRAAFGVCEIYPHIAVALLTEEAARIDAVALKLGIRSDRGNLAALARVCVKSPAVVRAFDSLPVALARRKRKSPMRTHIANRKRFPRGGAPQNQR